jgi:hypothetical protein
MASVPVRRQPPTTQVELIDRDSVPRLVIEDVYVDPSKVRVSQNTPQFSQSPIRLSGPKNTETPIGNNDYEFMEALAREEYGDLFDCSQECRAEGRKDCTMGDVCIIL